VSSQHLSDEAIAAFADGVLRGHARDRAARHAAGCPECAHAVAGQREAVWALRAAPAPALPIGLLDRLRSVPATTPINTVPTAIGPDGSAMFAAFGTMTAAALVPPATKDGRQHRVRPVLLAAAAIVTVGAFAFGSTGQTSAQKWQPIRSGPGTVVPAGFVHGGTVPTVQTQH
jgi:anti-sigma factor RsiW